ncbi:MAG: zf-HC2 domain-containing protein [Longimicrobiales bacterium]
MSHDSCLDALLKLYPYLDGELGDSDAEVVRLHFDLCSPCTPALLYLRSFRNALHRASIDQPPAPEHVRHRIQASLRTTGTDGRVGRVGRDGNIGH